MSVRIIVARTLVFASLMFFLLADVSSALAAGFTVSGSGIPPFDPGESRVASGRFSGESGDLLAVLYPMALRILSFSGKGFGLVVQTVIPEVPPDAPWCVGDFDGDGRDEILVATRENPTLYRLNGKSLKAVPVNIDGIAESALAADIDGSPPDELIIFRKNTPSNSETTLILEVLRLTDPDFLTVWSDGGMTGFESPGFSPSDVLSAVGDIFNTGKKTVLVRIGPSGVSPSRYAPLEWTGDRFIRKEPFCISGGRISTDFRKESPFAVGNLQPCEAGKKTFLMSPFAGESFETRVFSISGDNIRDHGPAGQIEPGDKWLWVRSKGKNPAILHLYRDLSTGRNRFKAFTFSGQ
ncbi:MAG: VCBS repeat-containing protein [Thermovirgaceae bacterium]|nr:VCBS repeat-containing protein [Thermovirgaceae bacterium]